jgi:hypothetical protein
VTNFGESGYVSTQGMIELQLQVRSGNIPDVVVFYDGINDIAAAAQSGQAGVPQNEFNRSREFSFGRAVYGSETGVGSDWRAARAITGAILQRLQFVQRLLVAFSPSYAMHRPTEEVADDIVTAYLGNVEFIESLKRTHGFDVLYIWQPTPHTTTKILTPHEQKLLKGIASRPFSRQLRDLHRIVAPKIDSAMRTRVRTRFVNASDLFKGDTISVFSDEIGHNTEKAIPYIVDAFYPNLLALAEWNTKASSISQSLPHD